LPLIESGCELCAAVTEHLLPAELEIHFASTVLDGLLRSLGSESHKVRRGARSLIFSFVKRTRNIELVLQYLCHEKKQGFNSTQYFIRQKTISMLPKLLKLIGPERLFTSASALNEMRKTLENLIIRVNDPVSSVRDTAKKAVV
jgi:hypothetical protein